eukprot:TRINITY_DN12697_c0_g1_i1.p1 TRINITY_DN12697_c0_g1~~TRINITY_DN12697_c0_g1_i1.p1  ORF type:complete len:286 (+),score=66.70 TRINITY_DN12697_c0_g1_i1:52-858(+)
MSSTSTSFALTLLLLALLVVGVFVGDARADIIKPQVSFLAQFRANDPYGRSYCACSGLPGSTLERCSSAEGWAACQSCQTGQIAYSNINNGECLNFGGIGGVASSFVPINDFFGGAQVSNSIFSSIHYDGKDFVYWPAGNNVTKFEEFPETVLETLSVTTSTQKCAPVTVGNVYIARISNKAQTTMTATSALLKLVVLPERQIRWNLFYGDSTCSSTAQPAQDEETILPTNGEFYLIIALAAFLLLLVVVLFILLFKRTGRKSEYDNL